MSGRELLTSSRSSSLLTCPRRHYWRYERGLRVEHPADALRFGSAWAEAMERRWKGEDQEAILEAIVPEDERTLDEYQVATVTAMMIGYEEVYGERPDLDIHPEVQFEYNIPGSRTFKAAGKLDGLGTMTNSLGSQVQIVLEHKTTAYSLDPDSDYWLRLRANPQLFEYVLAAREAGWNIQECLYDVARKPGIRPRQIPILDPDGKKIVTDRNTGSRVYLVKTIKEPVLDEDGLKIVIAEDGSGRVFKKDGSPKQTAGKGESLQVIEKHVDGAPRQSPEGDHQELQTRSETPEEFHERLLADIRERPDFYFARRMVPILEDAVEEYHEQRLQVSRMILDRRRNESRYEGQEHRAWPRNLSPMTCPMCPFSDFCLQERTPTKDDTPPGFEWADPHEELDTENEPQAKGV